jgi:hypothetical protein
MTDSSVETGTVPIVSIVPIVNANLQNILNDSNFWSDPHRLDG